MSVSSAWRSLRVAPITALALAAPLVVRLPPALLGRTLQLLVGLPRLRRLPAEELERRLERGLAIAGRLGVRHSCLTRGVTRYVVLRRGGVDVELAFGLGPEADGFAGHCWLELAGTPYLEREDPRGRFPEIFRIPARSAS